MAVAYQNLELLLKRLEERGKTGFHRPYYIPGLWYHGQATCKDISSKVENPALDTQSMKRDVQDVQEVRLDSTVEINPYQYLSELIRGYILQQAQLDVQNYLNPLSFNAQDKGWLQKGAVYSIDVRSATSWDHDGDGEIVQHCGDYTELGTYLKTFFLLPHIKEMGLDILYLLPILKPSTSYSKGGLGSFYSIKNFYQLNPELHDPILDEPGNPFPVEVEFRAFIEACHLLGIRVIFDFPLRTAARDNDLLIDHPDWFYWVKKKDLSRYQVPEYDTLGEHVAPTVANLHHVYPLELTREYIKLFSFPPNEVDPKVWEELKAEYLADPKQNILEMIEERFGVTTAPAYSDWINDPQPSWDDITFLKLYLDPPAVRDGFFDGTEPPFLFFDAIKTNLYPGKKPNKELWDYLAGNIRFYQENFGIDGARIDMAHALPEELEKLIIHQTLDYDPDFKFISEDLQNSNSAQAMQKGYHSIIGETWGREGRLNAESLVKLLEELPGLALPSFACAETPDTPRAAVRNGGRVFSRMVAVMNFFLPNSIPFVNSGFELFERQPMNLGLDNTEEGRYMLDKDDPYYGRLSFFDAFQLHWQNEKAVEMIELIDRARQLREAYWEVINDIDAFYVEPIIVENVVQFGYQTTELELICLVNLDYCDGKAIGNAGEMLLSSAKRTTEKLLLPGEFRVSLRKYE